MAWLFSKKLMDSASLPCSQEQVAEYSAESYLDGAQCALWNGTLTQQASWLPAKMTDACRLSRSGMTFKPLTDDLGEAVLMSFLEDFPAKTSAQQEREPALTESDQVCGDTWRELSVKFDLNTSSWRTHQCLWDEDLPESSVTLPKWGMMQNWVLWERITLPPLTSGTGSGSWPTPRVGGEEGYETVSKRKGHKAAIKHNLTAAVQHRENWPTPVASMHKGSSPASLTRKSGKSRENDQLDHAVMASNGGQLNPTWVEWLMGWPLFWTTLDMNVKPYYDAWYEAQQRTQTSPEEIQSGVVRNVWWDNDPSETPQGRQSNEQQQRQCDDSMPTMPCENSLFNRELGKGKCEAVNLQDMRGGVPTEENQKVEAVWQAGMPKGKREVVSRVAVGVKARKDRLKAIGNGQVSAVAKLAWEILTE